MPDDYRDKLEMLRGEQIKANFLFYGHTVFALHCREHWRGFRVWNGLRNRYE